MTTPEDTNSIAEAGKGDGAALPNVGDMILMPSAWAGCYELFRVCKVSKQMWQLEEWRASLGWGRPSRKYAYPWLPISGEPESIAQKLRNYEAQERNAILQIKDQYAAKVKKLSETGA